MTKISFRNNRDLVEDVKRITAGKIKALGLEERIKTNPATALSKTSCLYLKPVHIAKPSTQIIPSGKRHNPDDNSLIKDYREIISRLDEKIQLQLSKMNVP